MNKQEFRKHIQNLMSDFCSVANCPNPHNPTYKVQRSIVCNAEVGEEFYFCLQARQHLTKLGFSVALIKEKPQQVVADDEIIKYLF